MHHFWDDLIERKYSNRSRLFDLHITELTKFKSGDYNQYFGYCCDDKNMVSVCYYENQHGKFIGLGVGETEYEAEDMTTIGLNTDSKLDDSFILQILKNHYKWKIDNFFNLCE